MYLKDYNRKILLENGGIIEGGNSEAKNKDIELTLVQEEQKLKEEFKAAASQFEFPGNDDDDDDFLVKRQKTVEELKVEEEDYQMFLLESMADADDAETLKQWQNYKNNPNVNEDEAFLME